MISGSRRLGTSWSGMAETSGIPDDELAAGFRNRFLDALDETSWVPIVAAFDGRFPFAPPGRLLAEPNGTLADLLPIAFPPRYLD